MSVINDALEKVTAWGETCSTLGYLEQASMDGHLSQSGMFDIVRQKKVYIDGADSGVTVPLATDYYRMRVNIVDGVVVESKMYTLEHVSGYPFLIDPYTGANLRSLQLHVQESPQSGGSKDLHMEVAEETVQSGHAATIFTLEREQLDVTSQFHGGTRLEDEHVRQLVGLLDAQMPKEGAKRPYTTQEG